MRAELRMWFSPHRPATPFVAFLREPQIRWEVELNVKLAKLDVPLPDFIEDDFAAWMLRRHLSRYTCESPLELQETDHFQPLADQAWALGAASLPKVSQAELNSDQSVSASAEQHVEA